MKLTGGEFRTRILAHPLEDSRVRPTKEKVRQAVFNVLQSYDISSFLDLYCGCGAVGLEALSRGVETVHFMDKSTKWVEQNVKTLRAEERVEIFKRPLPRGLNVLKQAYDCIYLDPPWRIDGFYEETLAEILNLELLNTDGVVICETPFSSTLVFEGFRVIKESKYGNTRVVYLNRG